MVDKKFEIDFKKLLANSKQVNVAPLDAVKDGEEIGLMDGTKFEFKDKGDCLVGIIIEREYREKPYKSYAYQLENLIDMYFFWGNTVIDSRTKDLALPALVKIESMGMKTPASGGLKYMDVQIFEYLLPKGVDPQKHVAFLDPSDNQIKFYDRHVRDEPKGDGVEKGGK